MQEMWIQSLGQEDPLEKEIETHFSVLGWEIPWTEEPGQLKSMGVTRVRNDLATKQQQQRFQGFKFKHLFSKLFSNSKF